MTLRFFFGFFPALHSREHHCPGAPPIFGHALSLLAAEEPQQTTVTKMKKDSYAVKKYFLRTPVFLWCFFSSNFKNHFFFGLVLLH